MRHLPRAPERGQQRPGRCSRSRGCLRGRSTRPTGRRTRYLGPPAKRRGRFPAALAVAANPRTAGGRSRSTGAQQPPASARSKPPAACLGAGPKGPGRLAGRRVGPQGPRGPESTATRAKLPHGCRRGRCAAGATTVIPIRRVRQVPRSCYAAADGPAWARATRGPTAQTRAHFAVLRLCQADRTRCPVAECVQRLQGRSVLDCTLQRARVLSRRATMCRRQDSARLRPRTRVRVRAHMSVRARVRVDIFARIYVYIHR